MSRKNEVFKVPANSPNPINTRLRLKKGAKIHIVSQGVVQLAQMFGSVGPVGMTWIDPRYTPETYGMSRLYTSYNYGALVVLCGDQIQAVGGGLLNWIIPSPDEINLHINDVSILFNDNNGAFGVEIEYDTEDLA